LERLDNETQSAEAFQAHPLLLLVVSQILPGKYAAQEKMAYAHF
jgi:hypothetical protein